MWDIAAGLIPGEMHLPAGQEPAAGGLCYHLTTDDAVTATHRPHHLAIAHGVGPTRCRSARRVVREGDDVTIVTLSLSVHHALAVAERLAESPGIDAEVVDLRSLVPLDREAILTSVGKTGRLVVVDEDYRSFGLTGEVVATVTDQDPRMLRAPVERVAVPDVPIPYAHDLEAAVLPNEARIEEAVRRVAAA